MSIKSLLSAQHLLNISGKVKYKIYRQYSLIIEGLIHKRKELYSEKDFIKIISYGAGRNDSEFINNWRPDLMIIDEAQRIKNWKTQTARSVKKIQSEYLIVLTGTPLKTGLMRYTQ